MKEMFVRSVPLAVCPKEINGKTNLRRMHKEEEKSARRWVMDGYPITRKFETVEEINEYLHGEKITCLICGQAKKALVGHLRIHGVSTDKYKEMYGLPYRTGLSSEGTKERYRERCKTPNHVAHLKRIQPLLNSVRPSNRGGTARLSNMKTLTSRKNVEGHIGHPKFTKSDILKVTDYMVDNDVPLKRALKLCGGMSEHGFRVTLKRYPEINYSEIKKKISKGQINPISKNEQKIKMIQKLKKDGKTYKEIGAMLGIHEETAGLYGREGCRPKRVKGTVTANVQIEGQAASGLSRSNAGLDN